MSSGGLARTAQRRTRTTYYRPHRRRALLGSAAVVLVLCAAFVGAGYLLDHAGRTIGDGSRVLDGKGGALARHRTGSSAIDWPQTGQAAFALGNGRSAASPHQRATPIASLAKVMTAYLTLERYPLSGIEDGFTLTVTDADARVAAEDASRKQSIVAVRPGEQLTERQLLQALLIPSANNVASMLADTVSGSETSFVAEMNAEARALGMRRTTYTDPSGFDPGTVSTAADQLRILRRAMRFAVFRQIVSMADVTLPVAGTLTNFNPLIAEGYAGKTGSDSAAGGCLAFFTTVALGARRVTATGVVMGQGEGSDTSTLLSTAGEAAVQLVESVAPAHQVHAAGAPGVPVGPGP